MLFRSRPSLYLFVPKSTHEGYISDVNPNPAFCIPILEYINPMGSNINTNVASLQGDCINEVAEVICRGKKSWHEQKETITQEIKNIIAKYIIDVRRNESQCAEWLDDRLDGTEESVLNLLSYIQSHIRTGATTGGYVFNQYILAGNGQVNGGYALELILGLKDLVRDDGTPVIPLSNGGRRAQQQIKGSDVLNSIPTTPKQEDEEIAPVAIRSTGRARRTPATV